jgi:hypothetical protein
MRTIVFAMPVLLLAGTAVAQSDGRPDPMDPRAKVPPVEFRSAFEGYRPYAEPELRDWRNSNEEVGAAGGHAGHRPHQGAGTQTSKPQPGSAEKSEGTAAEQGHGAHK